MHDAVVARRFHRVGFGLLPDAVAALPAGAGRRAHHLYRHHRMIAQALARQQGYENACFLPALAQRAPTAAHRLEQLATGRRQLTEQIESLTPMWQEWLAESTAEGPKARLVDALRVMVERLTRVLDDEERHLLPLLERWISEGEWSDFGRYLAASMSKRELILLSGMIAASLTPPDIEDVSWQQPMVVWAIRHIGYPYYRHYARLLGFPAPPPLRPIPQS